MKNLLDRYLPRLTSVYQDARQAQQVLVWLLEKVLEQSATQIWSQIQINLNPSQYTKLDHWIKQIVDHHQPFQYLIGSVPFLDLEILVESPTLIPRPETEWWVDLLRSQFKKLQLAPLKILDVGTGTGCIALSLAKFFTNSCVTAVDCSSIALELAQKNQIHNQIKNVQFILSDLYQSLADKYDLVVSNPPYISQTDYLKLEASVRNWEDYQALVSPEHDLSLIEKIIDLSPHYLQHQYAELPQLWLEIDSSQGSRVQTKMNAHFKNSLLLQDQFKRPRVVIGKF